MNKTEIKIEFEDIQIATERFINQTEALLDKLNDLSGVCEYSQASRVSDISKKLEDVKEELEKAAELMW